MKIEETFSFFLILTVIISAKNHKCLRDKEMFFTIFLNLLIVGVLNAKVFDYQPQQVHIAFGGTISLNANFIDFFLQSKFVHHCHFFLYNFASSFLCFCFYL